jgi:hypothetical protein
MLIWIRAVPPWRDETTQGWALMLLAFPPLLRKDGKAPMVVGKRDSLLVGFDAAAVRVLERAGAHRDERRVGAQLGAAHAEHVFEDEPLNAFGAGRHGQ